jgi:hypothetical protein
VIALSRAFRCILVFAAACGGRFDIGHDAPDSGPDSIPDSGPPPVYAGPLLGDGGSGGLEDGGGATPMVIATQQGLAGLIASDGTRIYWVFSDPSVQAGSPLLPSDLAGWSVRGCDPSDCRDTVVTYVEREPAIRAIAADGVNVYWVARTDPLSSFASIVSCPKAGCPAAGPRQLTPLVAGGALVTDGSYLYWAEGDSSIQRCPVAGCTGAPEVVAVLDGEPTQLTVDDSSVYATAMETHSSSVVGSVFAVDKSGGAMPRLIADNQPSPSSLAVAGGRVYWLTQPYLTTSQDTGQLLACDVTGCAQGPSVIASGQRRPQSVLVDATRAYFLVESAVPAAYPPLDVVACPLAGCGSSPTVLAAMNTISPPMVATRDALFWLNGLLAGAPGAQPANVEGIAK